MGLIFNGSIHNNPYLIPVYIRYFNNFPYSTSFCYFFLFIVLHRVQVFLYFVIWFDFIYCGLIWFYFIYWNLIGFYLLRFDLILFVVIWFDLVLFVITFQSVTFPWCYFLKGKNLGVFVKRYLCSQTCANGNSIVIIELYSWNNISLSFFFKKKSDWSRWSLHIYYSWTGEVHVLLVYIIISI